MAREGWERFELVRSLGRGRFGETLLVKDNEEGGGLVAIKVPLDVQTEDALINELINAAVLRFSLKQMYHPNLVRYLGFGRYEGRCVMVMEYVKGTDLRKLIGPPDRSRRPMDLGLAVRLMQHTCAGLVAAHNARLQHNDIKPENILIRAEDQTAKLTDFGISKIRQSTGTPGTVAGTFPYMAPESFHGRSCFESDIWSLGVTFYEIATGRLPFFSENMGDLMRKIEHDDPIPPRQANPALESHIDKLISRALEKNPRQRFRSAQDMLSALEVDVDRHVVEARDLFNQGKPEEAEALLKGLLNSHPCEARLYLCLGELYSRCLRYGEGEKVLARGVENCPNDARVKFCLAMLLDRMKKREQAVSVLEQALALGLSADQQRQADRLLAGWKAAGS